MDANKLKNNPIAEVNVEQWQNSFLQNSSEKVSSHRSEFLRCFFDLRQSGDTAFAGIRYIYTDKLQSDL